MCTLATASSLPKDHKAAISVDEGGRDCNGEQAPSARASLLKQEAPVARDSTSKREGGGQDPPECLQAPRPAASERPAILHRLPQPAARPPSALSNGIALPPIAIVPPAVPRDELEMEQPPEAAVIADVRQQVWLNLVARHNS